MKTIKTIIVAGLLTGSNILFAQNERVNPGDSTGLPGDHFSLEGALEMFKLSASPEDFEKKLNSEDNKVNNLDLNGDDKIDYIRVVDHKDNNAHALVLQVPVNEAEVQDIAVIEIEKTGEESAQLQIIGDEELYGESKIAEPFEEKEIKEEKPGKGPFPSYFGATKIIVNVWFWPSVRFLYAPAYVVWVSPWRFGYYPNWWRPWRPHPWRVHFVHVRPYRNLHHVVYKHRVVHAHKVYAPHRRTSVVVVNRHKAARVNHKVNRPHKVQQKRAVQHQRPAPGNRGNKAGGVKRGKR